MLAKTYPTYLKKIIDIELTYRADENSVARSDRDFVAVVLLDHVASGRLAAETELSCKSDALQAVAEKQVIGLCRRRKVREAMHLRKILGSCRRQVVLDSLSEL